MNTMNTHSSHRPLYTRPLLWVAVLILGVGNIIVQRIRSDGFMDFLTQSPWQWPELTIAAATLILVVILVTSFVRTWSQRRRDQLQV